MADNIYEYKTKVQSNIPWGETFKMGRKAPAIANRIFNTLADAQLFIDNPYDSSIDGIRITILQDWTYIEDQNGKKYGDNGYVKTTETGDFNGVYYVKSIGDGITPGVLEKICRGNTAWFQGNSIIIDGSNVPVRGSVAGDLYLNTETLNIYMLQEDGTWKEIGNMGAMRVDQNAAYYILSTNGKVHPEFSIETWTIGNEDGTNIPTNYEDFEGSQVYLWTRIYDIENGEISAKYTVSLVYSSLNLGTFSI